MPTNTAGGFRYPVPTDPADVAADMKALAESIETGNPWVTTGFTVNAALWTLSSFRYKRVGGLIGVRIDVSKVGAAAVPAAGSGDFGNLKVGDMPAGTFPAFTAALNTGPLGRVCAGLLQTDGQVFLSSTAGDGTVIAAAEIISLAGFYFLG